MTRPGLLVVASGTATDIGKTFVGAAVLRALRAGGRTVAARKPVQSFAPDDPSPRDAEVLAAATGEDPATVCPLHRSLPLPVAPPMAAEWLGLPPFALADLVAEIAWVGGCSVGWVEGVGGPRSPLAADGDTVGLAEAIEADLVVVVAEAGLGAINAVRLSVDAFAPRATIVVLNRFDRDDALHRANAEWLRTREGLSVATDPEAAAQLVGVAVNS